MPTLATRSPTNPEFARVLSVAALRRLPDYAFDIAPEPDENAAVATLLGLDSLRRFRLAGRLAPAGEDWLLEARLGATVVQPCVVTLEPVTTRIDVPVRRQYRRMAAPAPAELELDAAEDDDLEPLGERIDLGLLAVEALALALPTYPRSEAAEAGAAEPLLAAAPAEEASPFAGLAELRRRMGGD